MRNIMDDSLPRHKANSDQNSSGTKDDGRFESLIKYRCQRQYARRIPYDTNKKVAEVASVIFAKVETSTSPITYFSS